MPSTIEKRLWSKIEITIPQNCWEWTRYKNRCGYGVIKTKDGVKLAHRIVWELENGEIPEGMCVCHTCDNPACCNPNHLFLGTHQDNMKDMVIKERIPKGEQNGKAKLVAEQILDIRRKWNRGISQYYLAKQYNLSTGTIFQIVHRLTWKHI